MLVLQDRLLEYMRQVFEFSHIGTSVIGDALQFHSYRVIEDKRRRLLISLDECLSTDANGVNACLGLQADPKIELERIFQILEEKISRESSFLLSFVPSDIRY